MTSFTVCTFNLRYGTAADGENAWPNRRGLVLELLERLAPDILATQEALAFQIDDIRNRFPDWGWVGEGRFRNGASGRPEEPGTGEHCAVFFKTACFQLVETWTRWLSEWPDEAGSRSWDARFPRIVTLARLRTVNGNRQVDVANTHFDWGDAFLKGSAGLLRHWLAAIPPDAAFVLAGDFNVDSAHPLQRDLARIPIPEGRRLRDVVAERGADAVLPTRHDFTGEARERIDWILASSDLRVREAWTETWSLGGRYPSDHFPVLARLAFTEGVPS